MTNITIAGISGTSTFFLDDWCYVIEPHAFIKTANGDTLLFDGRGFDKFGRPFILKKVGTEHFREYITPASSGSTTPAQKRSKTYHPRGPRLYLFPSMGR
jgi:hypothetical protein